MFKKKQKQKSGYIHVTKKMKKAHEKMLEDNREIASTRWKQFVDEMEALGYKIEPKIVPHVIPGAYAAVINLKGMSIEEVDRRDNPEKWAKIDEERAEQMRIAAEAKQKEKEEQAKAKEDMQGEEPVENSQENNEEESE